MGVDSSVISSGHTLVPLGLNGLQTTGPLTIWPLRTSRVDVVLETPFTVMVQVPTRLATVWLSTRLKVPV